MEVSMQANISGDIMLLKISKAEPCSPPGTLRQRHHQVMRFAASLNGNYVSDSFWTYDVVHRSTNTRKRSWKTPNSSQLWYYETSQSRDSMPSSYFASLLLAFPPSTCLKTSRSRPDFVQQVCVCVLFYQMPWYVRPQDHPKIDLDNFTWLKLPTNIFKIKSPKEKIREPEDRPIGSWITSNLHTTTWYKVECLWSNNTCQNSHAVSCGHSS